jgi:hypothetical protein
LEYVVWASILNVFPFNAEEVQRPAPRQILSIAGSGRLGWQETAANALRLKPQSAAARRSSILACVAAVSRASRTKRLLA